MGLENSLVEGDAVTEQMTKSLTQVEGKQRVETRTATKPMATFIIVGTVGLLVILAGAVLAPKATTTTSIR